MRHPFRRAGRERGQATIEVLMLAGPLIIFIAAAYQLFQANQSVYRALAASHQMLFQRALARNCVEHDQRCEYTTDAEGDGLDGAPTRVVWDPSDGLPERIIPINGTFGLSAALSGLFGGKGMPMISSNRGEIGSTADRAKSSADPAPPNCPGAPCKVTRIGAGTYKDLIDGVLFLRQGANANSNYYGDLVSRLRGLNTYLGY